MWYETDLPEKRPIPLQAASTEIALMRRQLATTQQSLAETEKQLAATRSDLAAEQARGRSPLASRARFSERGPPFSDDRSRLLRLELILPEQPCLTFPAPAAVDAAL